MIIFIALAQRYARAKESTSHSPPSSSDSSSVDTITSGSASSNVLTVNPRHWASAERISVMQKSSLVRASISSKLGSWLY